MKYEMINNCGRLGIEFGNIEGHGSRVSRDFMRKLLKRILKRSIQYYEETGEHVFTYGERQLHSVVCPSIADITHSFMIEHPLTRKPTGEPEYRGNVDYWIYYRDYSFLMELKHVYFAYRNVDNPRESITRRFTRALKQLSNIRKKERRNLTVGKGLREIALEIIVFYKGSQDENRLKADLKSCDFRVLFKRLVKKAKLEHKSNLRALWILNKRFVEIFPYESVSEMYPAVAFVGNISGLETH